MSRLGAVRLGPVARVVAAPLLAVLAAAVPSVAQVRPASPASQVDPSPPPPPGPTVAAAPAVVDRPVRDQRIAESSGLAFSPTHEGLLWTVNDSGNPPVVHGIGPDGRTVVRLRLRGVPNLDWEAVTAWRTDDGRALVAVGDIGDNGAVRDQIEVDVLAEPVRLPAAGDGSDADGVPELEVTPVRRIRLRYPDQAKDAESLLVDPRTGRMYLVAKGLLRARVYLVPQSVWPGGSSGSTGAATLTFIGGLGLPLATDAAALPSGYVVVRNYSTALLLAPLPTAQRPLAPLAVAPLPRQAQGEGLAATETALYLSSEGRGSPILRLDLPESFRTAIIGATGSPSGRSSGSPTPAAGPSGSSGAGPGDPVDQEGASAGSAGLVGLGLLVVAGGVGVVVVTRFAASRRDGRPRGRCSG